MHSKSMYDTPEERDSVVAEHSPFLDEQVPGQMSRMIRTDPFGKINNVSLRRHGCYGRLTRSMSKRAWCQHVVGIGP